MSFNIQIEETETKGSFFIERNDQRVAEMTFSKAGSEKIIIDHTEVDDSLRGEGIGLALVEYAVEYVRERKIKMLPLCPFTKATLEKHPEWKDVW